MSEKEHLSKKTYSPEQIARKHGVTLDHIEKELAAGIKVEKEHTKSPEVAREIALDHLWEKPRYYSKLKAAGLDESKAPKTLKKILAGNDNYDAKLPSADTSDVKRKFMELHNKKRDDWEEKQYQAMKSHPEVKGLYK